ncbi:hypothetical protein GCM10011514_35400 [Emticicia aquatilis]|uniref:Outer membrane protein beta-barrel domain-containing protein n=1 Tax=Emticicia aquatilis TaxID=1537369 RepID=A0A916YZ54_9BACT|nr:hypothetical protein [Emticicia aquatilis]GGD68240.1 hypothetical protein GCM10011514_35400 [Emticicia aquatilis]
MNKVTILLVIMLFISHLSFSQTKNQRYADLSIAAVGGFSPALSYNYNWGLGKRGKFKIGTGIRFTYFSKGKTDLITAPASLTSGEKGPQVLFTENILSNFDTLKVSKIGAGYINIPIHLQYSFNQKFEIGFNIDAVGLSFGSKQSGTFYASDSRSLNKTTQTAKPTTFNLLLVSDNDLGSLNSELYARYWVNDKIGIRAGLSFQFVEYTTDKILTFENDRFRTKSLLPMVAISYKF